MPRFNRSLRSIHHARNNHCHRKSAVSECEAEGPMRAYEPSPPVNRRNRTRRDRLATDIPNGADSQPRRDD